MPNPSAPPAFLRCLSHPEVPLSDHLTRVAESMRDRAAAWATSNLPPRFPDIAFLVGLFHDLGKATAYFQRYVRGKRPENREGQRLKGHSRLSAMLLFLPARALAAVAGADDATADFAALAATLAVARHHASLDDKIEDLWGHLARPDDEAYDLLAHQLSAVDAEGIEAWLGARVPGFRMPRDVPALTEPFRRAKRLGIDLGRADPSSARALTSVLLYSLLLSCDKLDAALQGAAPLSREALPPSIVEPARPRGTRAVDAARTELARHVRQRIAEAPDAHVYTLTAPTGSGKTLTGLEAALLLRERMRAAGLPGRVVYALPFTSVIDQNEGIFRDVLARAGVPDSSANLLKHHHLADLAYHVPSDEGESIPAGEQGELLVESWSSEIVVTTFVQVFESLFSGRNRMAKKVCAMAGSVLVLDEVQAIPRRLWGLVRTALLELTRLTGARVILMTATRPLIFDPAEAVELAPDPRLFFRERPFQRVRMDLHLDRSVTRAELIDEVARDLSDSGTLVILNRVRSSVEFYRLVQDDPRFQGCELIYLSANITPRERRRRTDEVRAPGRGRRLIVSTQVVEAGVDFSCAVVHRELAPLDSIIQGCGRCNRNGEAPRGQVHLWRVVEDRAPEPWGTAARVYDGLLLAATRDVLGDRRMIVEEDFFDLGSAYFELMRDRTADGELSEPWGKLDFATVSAGSHLIDEADAMRQEFFVMEHSDPEARLIWDDYVAIQKLPDRLQAHKRFLDIKREFHDRVVRVWIRRGEQKEPIRPLHEGGGAAGDYDPETGYVHGSEGGVLFA